MTSHTATLGKAISRWLARLTGLACCLQLMAGCDDSLRSDARRVLLNYVLASGDGICMSFDGAAFQDVFEGTSSLNGLGRMPTITGAFSGQCLLRMGSMERNSTQTYWVRLVHNTTSDRLLGNILLENKAAIERELRLTGFQPN